MHQAKTWPTKVLTRSTGMSKRCSLMPQGSPGARGSRLSAKLPITAATPAQNTSGRIGHRALLRMGRGQKIAGAAECHEAAKTVGRPQAFGGDHLADLAIGIKRPEDRQDDQRHTRRE